MLGEVRGVPRFSLESVAKAAAVTRFTVYSQFGSRSALLEAVFDDRALAARMNRLPEVMAEVDALSGLQRLIGVFCDFWAHDHDRAFTPLVPAIPSLVRLYLRVTSVGAWRCPL